MRSRLADTRAQTVEDADRLMQEIADAEVAIAVRLTKAEAKVQAIKDAIEAEVAPIRADLEAAKKDLERCILAHQDWFDKPRARRTPFGQYGLRQCTRLAIPDEEYTLQAVQEAGLDAGLVKTIVALDKAAIQRELKAGNVVPGAALESGDVAFCQVSRAVIDDALSRQV